MKSPIIIRHNRDEWGKYSLQIWTRRFYFSIIRSNHWRWNSGMTGWWNYFCFHTPLISVFFTNSRGFYDQRDSANEP